MLFLNKVNIHKPRIVADLSHDSFEDEGAEHTPNAFFIKFFADKYEYRMTVIKVYGGPEVDIIESLLEKAPEFNMAWSNSLYNYLAYKSEIKDQIQFMIRRIEETEFQFIYDPQIFEK